MSDMDDLMEQAERAERRQRIAEVARLACTLLCSPQVINAVRGPLDVSAEVVAVRAARMVLDEAERTEP